MQKWRRRSRSCLIPGSGGKRSSESAFGHGKENLAAVLVTLNLIAFAYHTLAELTEDLWARARQKAGTRIAFFNHLRSITVFLVFASWRDLLANPHLRATPAKAAAVRMPK